MLCCIKTLDILVRRKPRGLPNLSSVYMACSRGKWDVSMVWDMLSGSSCKGSKWSDGVGVHWGVSTTDLKSWWSCLQHKEGWNRGRILCWCVLRCLMFVALCIWAFMKLINWMLVHKFQISEMITARKWRKIKNLLSSGWLVCSWEERSKRLVFMFKVSSIPASLFLMWNYFGLLMNFYFFAGEICALKSCVDLK